ncbi:MAG: hypothetical protein EA369_01950 [Bradymonadales bacterium]|nr:MAG: hypothetical protein EA369_01950 [Bradymonadales bacterium]
MVGLIWFVQMVHYPSFLQISREQATSFHKLHMRRTSMVVAPIMLCELVTGLLLVWLQIGPVSTMNLIGLVGIWLSTALIQVPLHRQIELGWSSSDIKKLILSNWIRTSLWSARGILLLSALIFGL